MEQHPESRLTWEEIESMLSYQLSDYQLKRIEKAHQEWLNGELISSEDLHKELEETLLK